MNNVIRTTIEAMASVLGGTQSLHTNAYDEAIGLPTEQTARIARNTQLILQEETGITSVADPWAGSYMMESLTDEMEQKAMAIIQEVEEMGGMTKYIASGLAKLRIEESATKKQARIDSGQEVLVGVNKYQLSKEQQKLDTIDVLQIDNQAVRRQQIARIDDVISKRDEVRAQEVLAKIEASARITSESTGRGDNQNNLLSLCVEAAAARCTLGEMSLAMENAWGRHLPTSSVVQGAYSKAFSSTSGGSTGGKTGDTARDEYQAVLNKVKEFEKLKGRRPRILVAKMGQDGHDRGAKVIASGFSDLGFDVDVGPLFQTPDEVALQALDADVHAIGISSQAAGHKTLLPALKEELEKKGMKHVIVIAGGVIPQQDYSYLLEETKSASAIFGPGTRVTQAANDTIDLILKANS
jgi:methylmalonyl-CoA mutase